MSPEGLKAETVPSVSPLPVESLGRPPSSAEERSFRVSEAKRSGESVTPLSRPPYVLDCSFLDRAYAIFVVSIARDPEGRVLVNRRHNKKKLTPDHDHRRARTIIVYDPNW